jgi:hypothetical protein
MSRRRELEELDQRALFAPDERGRAISAAVVWLAALAGVAAVVTAILGAVLAFDAFPLAATLGIAAVVLFVGLTAILELRTYGRQFDAYRSGGVEIVNPDPTPVPERGAMESRQRRAMLTRLNAQREARSQRAASGGSVSSTDAGRPAQGSSDATTEP